MSRDLNKFRKIRQVVLGARRRWLEHRTGAHIHPTSTVSLSATIVGGAPGAIEIGEYTLVAFKSLLLAIDPIEGLRPIRIGKRCFIGGGAIILPGVTIADEVIVGAGSVVTQDVPARCAVGGNPARILKRDIEVGPYGRLSYADENQRKNEI
ncbi:DapH/DapD/GlmU-related protein [Aurantiacibacter odishensis]|uniref:DapH/DapD/GlmU-related protein n=1 Tax=Aurantiacibacter odishensis TaxID=1155476 RepID=UPI000E73616B|nr:DapH/DapD/GlmU-related protein [Aurantiacibacter odishensis]